MRASSSSSSARSSRSRSSGVASVRAFSISLRRRSFISPAAFSVNVTATIRSSVPAPARTSPTMRPTRAVVLPVPAAASTKKLVPNSVRIRRRAVSVGKIGHGDARTARSGSRRSCGFRACATLLMRTADDPIVAEVTLPLVWCCREKGVGDRLADRFRDLDGRVARLAHRAARSARQNRRLTCRNRAGRT